MTPGVKPSLAMPWLPIYAGEADLQELLSWLNADEEIAFIISDGPKRWKAVSSLGAIGSGRNCIWHVPSGPLPLLGDGKIKDSHVPDPWNGWEEVRTGADPNKPYFGPGHPGIVWLDARPRGVGKRGAVGLSGFEWIGDRYRVIGKAAPEATKKWWQLRRFVKKVAVRIPRVGPHDGPNPEIYGASVGVSAHLGWGSTRLQPLVTPALGRPCRRRIKRANVSARRPGWLAEEARAELAAGRQR